MTALSSGYGVVQGLRPFTNEMQNKVRRGYAQSGIDHTVEFARYFSDDAQCVVLLMTMTMPDTICIRIYARAGNSLKSYDARVRRKFASMREAKVMTIIQESMRSERI
jgi:hypothetical protein